MVDANRYEDVRTIHVNRLAFILARADENSAKTLCEKFDEKIDCFANGDLDHAEDAVTHLWKLSKADGRSALNHPDDPSPVSPPTTFSCQSYKAGRWYLNQL